MKHFQKGYARYFPGDLMKNLETPWKTGGLAGMNKD